MPEVMRRDYRGVTARTFSGRAESSLSCDDVDVASIGVFCGSNFGVDPRFRAAASDLGRAIATEGHRLVYGGGHVGLMGAVADAALASSGEVVGVITEHLVGAEVAHRGLTSLEVAVSMHARKARMADLSDGVIVLPGGFGTLDETFELLTWNQLGLPAAPVVFFDVTGFFEPLFDFIDRAVRAGFVKEQHAALAQRATNADDAIRMATAPPAPFAPKWIESTSID
jgi:uncharacterized protein (TIGR00730 family)